MFSKYFIAKMLSQYLELHIKAYSNPDYDIFVSISVLFFLKSTNMNNVYNVGKSMVV